MPSPSGLHPALAGVLSLAREYLRSFGITLMMIVRSEGASLEAADVEPRRLQQAPTVRVTTRGVGAGGLGATGPSFAAGRLAPSAHFRGNDDRKEEGVLK